MWVWRSGWKARYRRGEIGERMVSLSSLRSLSSVECGRRRERVVIIGRRIILTWGHCMYSAVVHGDERMHVCFFEHNLPYICTDPSTSCIQPIVRASWSNGFVCISKSPITSTRALLYDPSCQGINLLKAMQLWPCYTNNKASTLLGT